MAVVKPFRALRYDEARGRPARDLVAPPYDVISDERRAELRARSPYNVVHLTLPDSEEEAARALEDWRTSGVLVEEPSRRSGRSSRTTSAPTASPARASGSSPRSASSRTTTGTVLPHERTHPGPKEGRLRLLRATRVQLEPIFLLYDGPAAVRAARPGARPRGRGGAALAARRPDARPLLRRQAAPDRRRAPPLRDGASPSTRRRAPASAFMPSCSSRPQDPGSDLPHAPRLRRAGGTLEGRRTRRRRAERSSVMLPTTASRRVRRRRPSRRASARRPARRHARPRRALVHARRRRRRVRRVDDGRGGRRLPAAADADRGRLRATRGAARCCRRRRRTSSPSSSRGLLFHPLDTRLARRCAAPRSGISAACSTELPTRAEREPVLAPGEGGDDTTAIDAAAERAVVRGSSDRRGLHARLGGARRARLRDGHAVAHRLSTRSTAR